MGMREEGYYAFIDCTVLGHQQMFHKNLSCSVLLYIQSFFQAKMQQERVE